MLRRTYARLFDLVRLASTRPTVVAVSANPRMDDDERAISQAVRRMLQPAITAGGALDLCLEFSGGPFAAESCSHAFDTVTLYRNRTSKFCSVGRQPTMPGRKAARPCELRPRAPSLEAHSLFAMSAAARNASAARQGVRNAHDERGGHGGPEQETTQAIRFWRIHITAALFLYHENPLQLKLFGEM